MSDRIPLDQVRRMVNGAMRELFERRQREAAEVSESYAAFWRRLAEVSMVGGKRIRPYLTMIGNGSLDERVVPVAAAQELLHIAMLIHDDIIDQDYVRHGAKNMSGLYVDVYGGYTEPERAVHYANSAALLGGDALISEAYRLIHDSEFPDDIKQKLARQLAVSIFEVIGGELLDVEAGFVNDVAFDPLTVYRYKTSSYSFIGPLLSGAYCSGMEGDTLCVLERFATNAGIAFQIQDDLLGVFGDEAETGKSTVSDLREGKQTMLVLYHKEKMTPEHADNFAKFGDMHATDEELERIKQDMMATGARERTAKLAEKYFADARADLDTLPGDARTMELRALIAKLEARKR